MISNLRVAIVHYWFVSRRGGERVIDALCELFPQADVFALLADPEVLSSELRKHKLTTSLLQRLPGSRRWHRHMLGLYPIALEQFDLRDYDLVVSSESGPAKGVITSTDTCHICYCHTPMRYIWDLYPEYKERSGLGTLEKGVFALTAHYARLWDQSSAARVDHFVANSANVARRIKKIYRRDADVIYPPVDVRAINLTDISDDHYLFVGQLVSYKRVDLAIEACNRLRRHLRIVGDGEEYKRLRRLAGPTVTFLGALPDNELREEYARCRALLFPGEEDFGIVPIEAQAAGKPVIAFGKGGALESVIGVHPRESTVECCTGIHFDQQSVESLTEAILMFETLEREFSPRFIRSHAERFDKHHFLTGMTDFIRRKLENVPVTSDRR